MKAKLLRKFLGVPLALWLLVIVTSTALAVWILTLPADLFATPAQGAQAAWSATQPTACGEYVDLVGDQSVTCWALTGNHRPNVAVTNARPGNSVWLEHRIVSTEPAADLCPSLDPATVTAYAALGADVSLTAAPIAHGATGLVRFDFDFNSTLPEGGPEIAFGDVNILLIEAAPGGCP